MLLGWMRVVSRTLTRPLGAISSVWSSPGVAKGGEG